MLSISKLSSMTSLSGIKLLWPLNSNRILAISHSKAHLTSSQRMKTGKVYLFLKFLRQLKKIQVSLHLMIEEACVSASCLQLLGEIFIILQFWQRESSRVSKNNCPARIRQPRVLCLNHVSLTSQESLSILKMMTVKILIKS